MHTWNIISRHWQRPDRWSHTLKNCAVEIEMSSHFKPRVISPDVFLLLRFCWIRLSGYLLDGDVYKDVWPRQAGLPQLLLQLLRLHCESRTATKKTPHTHVWSKRLGSHWTEPYKINKQHFADLCAVFAHTDVCEHTFGCFRWFVAVSSKWCGPASSLAHRSASVFCELSGYWGSSKSPSESAVLHLILYYLILRFIWHNYVFKSP